MQYVSQKARFSSCRRYRYSLERTWDGGKGRVLFIGLNPSTADHKKDDPTIRRCVGFAKSWGFSGMEIVNLFAYRATFPTDLLKAEEPVGKYNDKWIRKAHRRCDQAIACWGSTGSFLDRSERIANSLEDLHCIKINQDWQPAHPLYLKADLHPFPYAVADSRN
jgi:hypothetical protein